MNIEKLKKEFNSELSDIKINAKSLIKNKVSEKVLKSEIYLQNIYGDRIGAKKPQEEVFDENQKTVTKINREDISFNSGLKSIFEEIDNSEFDEKLSYLLNQDI